MLHALFHKDLLKKLEKVRADLCSMKMFLEPYSQGHSVYYQRN